MITFITWVIWLAAIGLCIMFPPLLLLILIFGGIALNSALSEEKAEQDKYKKLITGFGEKCDDQLADEYSKLLHIHYTKNPEATFEVKKHKSLVSKAKSNILDAEEATRVKRVDFILWYVAIVLLVAVVGTAIFN